MHEEVQRHALASEDRACGTFELSNHGSRRDLGAVRGAWSQPHGRINQLEGEVRCDQTRHDASLARWDAFVQLVRLCWVLDVVAAGDEATMRDWMHGYNRDLKAVPADLIGAERGLDEAISYLETHGPTRH